MNTNQRLASVDALRGWAVAAMLLVNNPGDWGHVYAPLEHAAWHGFTPTDLIFPFFLFIVGVAIPFSQAKRSQTQSRREQLLHILTRGLCLILLGILIGAVPAPAPAPPPDGYVMLRIHLTAGRDVPLTVLEMESMALPGPQLEVTTTRAIERETPTAFTELKRADIQEKYWAQDVPMLLAETPGAVLSRAQLEEKLYGWQEEVESNAVEVHIYNLRKKLGESVIRNIRGLGYTLAERP